jgi:hypothetical protein
VSLVVTDALGEEGRAERITRVIAATGPDPADLVLEGLPSVGTILARDIESNSASVTIEGPVPEAGFESIKARVMRDGVMEEEAEAELCGERFTLTLSIPAERMARSIELSLRGLEMDIPIRAVNDIVAGDIYLLNGQSNAFAREFSGSADENLGDYVRSFGSRTENERIHSMDAAWHRAVVNGVVGAVGQWALRMVAQLSDRTGIPIGIINGARGGRPITYFARNDAEREDLSTNYGRLLDRTRRSGALGHIRAILFYQGESDGLNATAHHDGFVALHENWREDYPGVEHFYVTQVRRGCGGQVETREVQRRFPEELPNTSVMSTTGLNGHDGCHFAYAEGYRELGDRYANLLARDLYGEEPAADTEAVNVSGARIEANQIVIQTVGDASGLLVEDGSEAFFELRGGTRTVTGVRAMGTEIILDLSAGDDPSGVAYIGHPRSGPWITNTGGVGLLAFLLDL